MDLLLTAVSGASAAVVALAFDFRSRSRGFDPPGFARPARRAAFLVLLASVLWLGVFLPLVMGSGEVDLARISRFDLFTVQVLLAAAVAAYVAGGFLGERRAAREVASHVGWSSRRIGLELALGLVAGIGIWAAVLIFQVSLAAFLAASPWEGWLPEAPPAVVVWIVNLPAGWKIALALTAGVVEETFFRGLLQPRLGWGLTSLLFALAHAGYGEPSMLGGLFLFSLLASWLVVWRQSVWAAVAAHALFDLLQLFVVIPAALYWFPPRG